MNNYLVGADVSFWQDDPTTQRNIDFKRMRSQSPYVFIRAGQNTWSDKMFSVSWKNAKEAGLLRGSYWFYDSRAEPEKQAEKYIQTLGSDFGELPLVADFEDKYGGNYGTWEHWYRFMDKLQKLSNNKDIIIYTGYYYWTERTATLPEKTLNYFGKFPLWIAQYGSTSPRIPKPWKDWTFWQYTDNGIGEPYGVESKNIDLNYYNGDLEKFEITFGKVKVQEEIPSPEKEEEVRKVRGKVVASELNVRSEPTANSRASAQRLKKNTEFTGSLVEGANKKELWIKLTAVAGNPVSFPAFIAAWYTEYSEEEAEAEVSIDYGAKTVNFSSNKYDHWKLVVNGTEYTLTSIVGGIIV